MNRAAQQLGRLGGKGNARRFSAMTPEERRAWGEHLLSQRKWRPKIVKVETQEVLKSPVTY